MVEDIIETGGILIVLVLIVSGIQWFLVRFTHWSVALVATGFIAIFISFVYVSLSHASPNGSDNGTDASEFITPTLVIFASLLCGFALVCYLTKIRLPNSVFILPLILIVVFVIGRYVYEYVDDVTFYYRQFSSCKIELVDKTAGKSIVKEISFQNTSNGLVSNIETGSGKLPYPMLTRGSNEIIFRCYSTKINNMSVQDFPFDYSLCKEKDGPRAGFCFWIREKKVLPIKIVLLSADKVNLYIDNRLVKQYQLMEEELLE